VTPPTPPSPVIRPPNAAADHVGAQLYHNEPWKSWGDKEMGGEYALLFQGKISALNHHNALMRTYKHL